MVLGIGFGGFVDGILLHQILQWHHLLSERGYGTSVQIAADGFFHGLTWIAVLAGVLWLWQRLRYVKPVAWSALVGPMLAGWGAFNLVEGVVDHHLLDVHHVRSGAGQLWWDLGFLVFGTLLVAVGTLLYRRSARGVDDDGALTAAR
jgi:uncharacterized membrane protein